MCRPGSVLLRSRIVLVEAVTAMRVARLWVYGNTCSNHTSLVILKINQVWPVRCLQVAAVEVSAGGCSR
jgi:hypothetical protein